MFVFLIELVIFEEEICFLRGKKKYLEFYVLERWLLNLNFKNDDSYGAFR